MTIYDVPNIDHCDVEEFGNPVMLYRVIAHEGWWINSWDPDPIINRQWKTAIAPRVNTDFSKITIVHESELPPDAELCAELTEEEADRIERYRVAKVN